MKQKNILRELPYYKEIRASWKANLSHCNENSPSKRDSFIKNNIKFAPEWLGELGFLRYYLFHIDNNYIPGKSILQRMDRSKGFSPENCIIVVKPKNKCSEVSNNKNSKRISEFKEEGGSPLTVNLIISDSTGITLEALLRNLSAIKLKRA